MNLWFSRDLNETLCSQDVQTVASYVTLCVQELPLKLFKVEIQTTHTVQIHSLKEPRGLFAHPTNKQHQKNLPLWYACPFTLSHPPHTPHPHLSFPSGQLRWSVSPIVPASSPYLPPTVNHSTSQATRCSPPRSEVGRKAGPSSIPTNLDMRNM